MLPTYPSLLTAVGKDSHRRFMATGFPSGDAEDYRPGGFHPVHLNDRLKDSRYRVVRKLGYGSYSTVWLAFNSLQSQFVALKVIVAKSSTGNNDGISICKYLTERAKQDGLAKYVTTLVDSFEHTGPNGTHACLAFEPMSPSTASMVDELPCNQPRTFGKRSRYPNDMAKAILKQILSSLAFIHKHNVAHGDVQSGNVLFAVSGLRGVGEEQLRQAQDKISPPLQRLDGKPDHWAPRYLTLGESLHDFVDLTSPPIVKLSDFGAGMIVLQQQSSAVDSDSRCTAAPELIFNEPFESAIDIWAFGCLVYEFITGMRLFSVDLMGNDEQDDADDDHILDLIDVLGPLPERLIARWERRDKWIGPNGERLQPEESKDGSASSNPESDTDDLSDSETDELGEAEGIQDDEEITGPVVNDSLEVQVDRNKPDDIAEEETKVITALIREILQYEPSQRPTVEQLLRHD